MDGKRETLGSRLGFLFLAAGCAIGLGNIWRFPFVVGQNGGAFFVLIYIFFLAVIGFPLLVMELSIGRAAQRNVVGAVKKLAPKYKNLWYRAIGVTFSGNVILMIFYTTICGMMLAYAYYFLAGKFTGINEITDGTKNFFGGYVSNPITVVSYMLISVFIGSLVCFMGLKNGVERITKILMIGLLFILIGMVFNSIFLPNAGEGLRFYLYPTIPPVDMWFDTILAALGQAFFTLSLGIGSMAIFGSYIDKSVSLTTESLYIIFIDTFVAIMAGLVIFPACSAFNVEVDAGPSLIFVTLPYVFDNMRGGQFFGSAFFIFMSLAAITTVIAVFENIVGLMIDEFNFSRKKSSIITFISISILSLPCALGFNVLSNIQPMGEGSSILDFEDFLVSDTMLPLGALLMLLFCTKRYGWGWKNFLTEANTGKGLKYPQFAKIYISYIIPLIIIGIFFAGYLKRFF